METWVLRVEAFLYFEAGSDERVLAANLKVKLGLTP